MVEKSEFRSHGAQAVGMLTSQMTSTDYACFIKWLFAFSKHSKVTHFKLNFFSVLYASQCFKYTLVYTNLHFLAKKIHNFDFSCMKLNNAAVETMLLF